MRNAQVIDLEAYRARRAPAVAPTPEVPTVPNPFATVPIMWVPVWYWVPVNLILG